MKIAIVFAAILAAALAAPTANLGIDGYQYSYDVGNYQPISYSFIGPDGRVHYISFIADENGFQPSNLPRP